jgi:hypothetical protein
MQDRRRQFDEIFLQRTAGPYIGVKLGRTQREQMSSGLPLKADIAQCKSACPKGAMNGLMQRSKVRPNSITSSAVASTVGRKVQSELLTG